MTANVEQHQAFEKGLEELKQYCEAIQAGEKTYDPGRVLQMLRAFAGPFSQHMRDEIETLSPEKTAKIFPSSEDYRIVCDNMIKWSRARAPKTKILPWVCNLYGVC
jgi:hypothetical protein